MSTLVESKQTRIDISSELSPNLAFRDNARAFCEKIDSYEADVISIDFSGTSSITRSFAQEYISFKSRTTKNIDEINVPDNVIKMFRVVQDPGKKKVIVDMDKIKIICI
ncbi:MAG: STAS-like domain-containing protein [Candidatus Thorarchaeota archaeon]